MDAACSGSPIPQSFSQFPLPAKKKDPDEGILWLVAFPWLSLGIQGSHHEFGTYCFALQSARGVGEG